MKQIQTSSGGRKLFNEDLEVITEHLVALEKQFIGEAPFVISGNAPVNTGGTLYNFSELWLWVGNKVRYFSGQNAVDLAADKSIQISDSDITRQNVDNTQKVAISDYGVGVSLSTPIGNNTDEIVFSLNGGNVEYRTYRKDFLDYLRLSETQTQTVSSPVDIQGDLNVNGNNNLSVGGEVYSGDNLRVGGGNSSGGTTLLSNGEIYSGRVYSREDIISQNTIRCDVLDINLVSGSGRIYDGRSIGGTTNIVDSNGMIRNERIITDSDATFVSANDRSSWDSRDKTETVQYVNYATNGQDNWSFRILKTIIYGGFATYKFLMRFENGSNPDMIFLPAGTINSDLRPNYRHYFVTSSIFNTNEAETKTSYIDPNGGIQITTHFDARHINISTEYWVGNL